MYFLDHASTTPLSPRVRDAMEPWMARPLNPSSVHRHGQQARSALERARERVAEIFAVAPRHVVFTASATEANNLVLRSLAEQARQQGTRLRLATSRLEHACIRETSLRLENHKLANVEWLAVEPTGTVTIPDALACDLLCVMAVQNETGVVQQLDTARAAARAAGARWLCDATQAVGLLELNLVLRGIDFASLSSHKISGPPGVGALVGTGVESLAPQITGGPQENEHRAGTQPVALIVGFGEALALAAQEREHRRAHLAALESEFLAVLRHHAVPFLHNGGDAPDRLPGFLNLSVPGFAGADLVIALDARGFSVSSGAACATGVIETSPAMAAMFPHDEARAAGALRITPGHDTPAAAMRECATALAAIVAAGSTTGRFARRPTS